MSAEQYIASAKAGLTSIRSILNTPNWRSGIPNVRTCISYINSSQLMLNKDRMEERLWILNEVQQFAYHDPDAGGVTELASWCELEYNRILAYDPNHVRALKALGQAWLWKSQFWLAKIHHEDSNEDDDRVAERRRHTPNYVEARAALIPAVDFFVRVVECASQQRCLTGELLVLRAEASMSLGNVSPPRNAQGYFKDALLCLKNASQMPGYRLSGHLTRYLRENEHLLRM